MKVIGDALQAAGIVLIATAAQLKDAVSGTSNKPMVLDVYSEGCGYSRMMATPFVDLKGKYSDSVTFAGADVGENSSVAGDYKISGLPTFVGFACGHEVDRVIGADSNGLEKLILQLKDTKC